METHEKPDNESAPSVRESLMAAVSEVENADGAAATAADEKATPDPNAAPPDGRPRDPQGRFTENQNTTQGGGTKPDAPNPDTSKTPSTAEQAKTGDDDAPPASWNAPARELFAKADPELRKYIRQRESEQLQGVEKLKADLEPRAQWADEMWGVISPYDKMIKAERVTPAVAVKDLLGMAALMRTGTPEQKRQLLLDTAQQFGVDLTGQQLQGQHPQQQQQDPAFAALQRELSGVKQTLTGWQQQQAEARQRDLTSQIETFKADKPHFDKVRVTMGQLMQSGAAKNLQDAYDKAVRLDNELWTEVQAEQRSKDEAEQRAKAAKEAEKKKQAAGSVTGAPGLAGTGQAHTPSPTVRAALERAMSADRA